MFTRREFLTQLGGGIGTLALAQLIAAEDPSSEFRLKAVGPLGGLHHPAKARRVIQLFMNGG
ncbi:MAG TPA: DUF1501 domain-containing protein, partial [Verrucomicrobiae bacterium]|nr:DUF1501 domain-containing protein [Verrucomicrobiae bacterium]